MWERLYTFITFHFGHIWGKFFLGSNSSLFSISFWKDPQHEVQLDGTIYQIFVLPHNTLFFKTGTIYYAPGGAFLHANKNYYLWATGVFLTRIMNNNDYVLPISWFNLLCVTNSVVFTCYWYLVHTWSIWQAQVWLQLDYCSFLKTGTKINFFIYTLL